MSRVLVVNRMNNMGDAMSQMRVLKEHRERNPDIVLDFVSNYYLHWIMANHSGLFDQVIFNLDPNKYLDEHKSEYNDKIEFLSDWARACKEGIVKHWGKVNFGIPTSVNKPLFNLTEEEKLTAWAQLDWLMGVPMEGKPAFRKSIVLQLESVSSERRGFLKQDYNKVIEMIPDDVAIFYMAPLSWKWINPFSPKDNLIVLPGYPIGHTAALMQKVDAVIACHSGPMFLAIAVEAKHILQIAFEEEGPRGLMEIEDSNGENIFFPSNRDINWEIIKEAIGRAIS